MAARPPPSAWRVAAIVVIPFGVASAGAKLLSPSVLLPGAAVALLASVIPYSLEMIALTRLPVRVFGTLLSLAPPPSRR